MIAQPSLGSILIIDDDERIADLLLLNLGSEGYAVRHIKEAADATPVALAGVQLIIVDAMAQHYNGVDLIKTLKSTPATAHIGIIFYSHINSERTIIDVLDAGADDCLSKPFSLRELMARVRSVMRRRRSQSVPEASSNVLRFRGLALDLERQTVTIDGSVVALSKTEYAILALLLRNANVYTSRIEIFRTVWTEATGSNDRIVDTNISRLRRKLGELGANIVNRSGLGYMLTDKIA